MINLKYFISCSFLATISSLNSFSFAVGYVAPNNSEEVTAKIYAISDKVEESGKTEVGTITFKNGTDKDGLSIQTKLKLPNVKAGTYGFHIHNNDSCAPGLKDGKMTAGMAAGDHYDPKHTTKHLGPYSTSGHLGDLPLLVVDDKGQANNTLSAPNLKLSDIINHSVMIHAGSDNYSDEPAPLGGGGARKFCGVIK